MRRITYFIVLPLFLVGAIVLSGCTAEQVHEPVTLTISYPSAQQFYQMYGYAFEQKNQDIKIHVIPLEEHLDTSDKQSELATDIVYTNETGRLKQWIDSGQVMPLSLPVGRPLLNTDSLSPIVTTLIRSAAEDKQLYAIAPTFHSEALFFNTSLFDEYQIPHPQDGVTWEDIFHIAAQFPSTKEDGSPLYGLQLNFYQDASINYLIKAGEASGLSYIDTEEQLVTMDEKWVAVWEAILPALQSGSLFTDTDSLEEMQHPAFMTQNAAMTVGSQSTAYSFEPFSQFEDGSTIDWGMVHTPVSVASPTYSNRYSIYDYFAISSTTKYGEEAARLLHFIATDKQNSRLLAQKRPNYGIPAVTENMPPIKGHEDLSAFYKLKPDPTFQNPYTQLVPAIIDAFKGVAQQILLRAVAGELQIEEALYLVQIEGQQAVDKAVIEANLSADLNQP